MELKNLEKHWAGFPAISMEERPVLSTEMESMLVKNPFPKDFYLHNKIQLRILAGILLLIPALIRLIDLAGRNADGLYASILLTGTLLWFTWLHIQLLRFADYPSLASLSLVPFLSRVENIFRKYIGSFRVTSLLTGLYLEAFAEWLARTTHIGSGLLIWQNDLCRLLLIAFLSVSAYILLLHFKIQGYKKLMIAVKSYREGISVTFNKQ